MEKNKMTVLMGYNKVLCVQTFGCMPNHVCGKGIYPSIQRELQNAQIVSIDYDSSGSEINVRNRIRMLLDIYRLICTKFLEMPSSI